MAQIPTGSFVNANTALFSRPLAYGSFSSTQTQQINPAFPTTAVLTAVYDTLDITPTEMACSVPSGDIVVGSSGTYKVLASVQGDKSTPAVGTLDMWVAVNGTAVPNTGSRIAINQNQEAILTVEWLLELGGGDAISVQFGSVDGGLQLLAVAAAPPVPAIPSIITTVVRIA